MPRWPWKWRARETERTTRATLATASVKAEALALVNDLRTSLGRLDTVLRAEVPDVGQNGTPPTGGDE